MEANSQFLESAKKQFLYYKTLGEKAINQLEDDQLFYCRKRRYEQHCSNRKTFVWKYAFTME